jgi:hypothetical protein
VGGVIKSEKIKQQKQDGNRSIVKVGSLTTDKVYNRQALQIDNKKYNFVTFDIIVILSQQLSVFIMERNVNTRCMNYVHNSIVPLSVLYFKRLIIPLQRYKCKFSYLCWV